MRNDAWTRVFVAGYRYRWLAAVASVLLVVGVAVAGQRQVMRFSASPARTIQLHSFVHSNPTLPFAFLGKAEILRARV